MDEPMAELRVVLLVSLMADLLAASMAVTMVDQ